MLETSINTGYNDASGSSSFYLLEMAWSNPSLSASLLVSAAYST